MEYRKLFFQSSFDISLIFLFCQYNGCKWKGGKLRLEKAEEHYLSRLRREWAADAVPSVPVTQDTETKNEEIRPRNLDMASMKIGIFVPKLNKVSLQISCYKFCTSAVTITSLY